MKLLLLIGLNVGICINAIGANFTSNGTGGGSWNSSTSWIVVGTDSDGIPDANDNVTIVSGDVINWSQNSGCIALIVNNGATIQCGNGVATLQISGDYINDGTEVGSGFYSFAAPGTQISGTGIFSSTSRWTFMGSRTIASTVTSVKTAWTRLYNGATVTNLGNISLASLNSVGSNGTWINGSGSILTLSNTNVTVTLDASSFSNTVKWKLSGTSSSQLPTTILNNTYNNLSIESSGIFCRLNANTIVTGDFTVNLAGDFDMNGFNLNVRGTFLNRQNFIQTPGTILTLDGTSAQSLSASTTTTLQNLVINNSAGVSVAGTGLFSIQESVTVSSGNFNVGSSKITLVSNATQTAYIGQGNGTFSGNMIIQRYIDARTDGYSDMSSPVSNATFAGWLDDMYLVFSAYVPNVTEPSAWGYDESIWDYVAIETSATAITPGMGYEVYLANDGDTMSSFSATTLDLTGTPNYGDISVAVTVDNDGWNLVGNPYASFIDWTTFSANAGVSMNSQFLYYDEAIEDFAAGNPGDVLAPGQGFWIECTTAGSAIFHENNKVVNTSSSFRNMNEELFALRVSSAENNFKSNTYFRFDEFASLAYEANHDLSFLKVPHKEAPSLFTFSSEGKRLRINELAGEESMSIPVMFIPGVNGSYTISIQNIQSIEMAGYNSVMLEDKQTGIFHDLKSGDYDFDALLTDNEDRFIVHLKSLTVNVQIVENEVTFTNSAEGVFANFNLAETESALISVFNVAGQEISNSSVVFVERNRVQITMPEEYHGIYIIRVIVGDKMVTQRYYKN